MKVKKAIDLFKKHGSIHIHDGPDFQWITDGSAIYPLFELPDFTEETICIAYDIDFKKSAKMNIKRYPDLPESINLEDSIKEEKEVEEYTKFSLIYGGRCLKAFVAENGIVFIDSAYLAPLSDISYENIRYFERTSTQGTTYIAVKNGLELVAAIFPVKVIEDTFVAEINTFAQLCENTFDIQKYKKGGATNVETH